MPYDSADKRRSVAKALAKFWSDLEPKERWQMALFLNRSDPIVAESRRQNMLQNRRSGMTSEQASLASIKGVAARQAKRGPNPVTGPVKLGVNRMNALRDAGGPRGQSFKPRIRQPTNTPPQSSGVEPGQWGKDIISREVSKPSKAVIKFLRQFQE